MKIGERLRRLRQEKGMSQGDVEDATGMLRCYTSRAENGHTVPSLATLEKYAAAFEVPLYRLFYEGSEPLPLPVTPRQDLEALARQPGEAGSEARFLLKFKKLLAKIDPRERGILLAVVQKMAAKAPAR